MSAATELYQEVILDYSRNPRNFHDMPDATHHAEGLNPLCGDHYELFMDVDETTGIVRDVSFTGNGCAISKASASLLSQALIGMKRADAEETIDRFQKMIKGELTPEESEKLGKLEVFSGVCNYPSRVKCAALSAHAAQSALKDGSCACTE